jgi:hypothetical protein
MSFFLGVISCYLFLGVLAAIYGWVVDKPWYVPVKFRNKRLKYAFLIGLDTLGMIVVWPFYVWRANK